MGAAGICAYPDAGGCAVLSLVPSIEQVSAAVSATFHGPWRRSETPCHDRHAESSAARCISVDDERDNVVRNAS